MASKTSARPRMNFAHDLCGFGGDMANQQHNDDHRMQRRMVHQELGSVTKSAQYDTFKQEGVHKLLARILDDPDSALKHVELETGAVLLKMAYGYTVETGATDPMVELMETVMNNFSAAISPFTWAVDILPFLKYWPSIFPGGSFQRIAQNFKDSAEAAREVPFAFSKEQIKDGISVPSYVARLLEQLDRKGESDESIKFDEDAIKWTAGIMYTAGSHTTVTSLHWFLLAMVMYPNVQKRAQEEITKVIGSDRLPQMEDRQSLPYLEALVQEIYRWNPVGPMSLPHAATSDVAYDGYIIPKGSIILPSVWWFCHDPEVYKNPTEFEPERYLDPRSEPDPKPVIFGFGRRTCVGRYFADSTIFLSVAQVLASFDIEKSSLSPAEDERLQLAAQGCPGMINQPGSFGCKLTPRSKDITALIRQITKDLPEKI
ncbi:unnamed protein product [Clonostachys byssicola]|uniref:Cytochrome P450 n=1 Tax=Clonostachys byssicola TaxID=160290 RepID=A0A9N9UCN2_9HYPO|nr:unnamed protein product [Clonostachys byssicola]